MRRNQRIIEVADHLSRRDTDEFGLRKRDEDFIKSKLPFAISIDIFGSDFLHVTKRFYSKIPSHYSIGTDGLYSPWTGEQVWLFPPRKLLPSVIRRIKTELNLQAVLVTLVNKESSIGDWFLDQEGHAPDYVVSLIQFPVKVKMASDPESDSPIFNSFASTPHHCRFFIIDKNYVQNDKSKRCSKPKGQCHFCYGNDMISLQFVPN